MKQSLHALLLFGLPLLLSGCSMVHCGCPPQAPEPFSVSGRLTDSVGAPLPGVQVSAVSLIGPGASEQPPIGFVSFLSTTLSDQDGRYSLHFGSGSMRVLCRPFVASVLYEVRISPEFTLSGSRPSVSNVDLVFKPIQASTVRGTVTPMRNSLQMDHLKLYQILTIDGGDYAQLLSEQQPALTEPTESFLFPLQPGGAYSLSLWRYETTGAQARSGTAGASFTLPEGSTADVALTIQ